MTDLAQKLTDRAAKATGSAAPGRSGWRRWLPVVIPVAVLVFLSLPWLLGGAVVIETRPQSVSRNVSRSSLMTPRRSIISATCGRNRGSILTAPGT